MLPYIFAICLVSFYTSLGSPVTKPVPSDPTPDPRNASNQLLSLNTLANSCENPFLVAQIKSKIVDCPELVPPSNETQFQCMLFYDINRQLCAAVSARTIVLNDDYTAQIEAQQDVSQLCNAARGWTYTDLGEVYKQNVKLVFENVFRCAKTCADYSNILSIESNFYCRYFKWGTEMLKSKLQVHEPSHLEGHESKAPDAIDAKKSTPNQDATASVKLPVPNLNDKLKLGDLLNVHSNDNEVVQNNSSLALKSDVQTGNNKSISQKPSSTDKNVSETNVEETKYEHPLNSQAGLSNSDVKVNVGENKDVKENSGVSVDEQHNHEEQQPKGSELDTEKDDLKLKEKTPENADDKNAKDDKKKTEQSVKDQIQGPDDYQSEMDSDEGKGMSDPEGGNDDDDLALGENDQQDLDLNKNAGTKTDQQQFSNDLSQREYYQNTDGFPEEDDHFFPFFLTAIIMVVLLYILYHNKSKVSKVIMGLIVEGRQPGRRRNSRGHAYKRLDTLEQAMSANTAAPPSKIIY